LPLAISGKPFTTMKKAFFHGRLRVKFHKSRLAFSVEQIVINNEST